MTRVLDDAASAGLNAVFVQVVRRHDAYYDSRALPPTPDPALAPGFDVLAAAVEGGHARGLQVHAWFTVATAWHESYRGVELPAGHVTGAHGPGTADPWMTVSRAGVQSGEYFDIGLPELHDHVAGVVADIASRYAVDGVHLDYVRYDGAQWGYHPRALQRFRAETGYQGVPAPSRAGVGGLASGPEPGDRRAGARRPGPGPAPGPPQCGRDRPGRRPGRRSRGVRRHSGVRRLRPGLGRVGVRRPARSGRPHDVRPRERARAGAVVPPVAGVRRRAGPASRTARPWP